jgi:hypothetical protein
MKKVFFISVVSVSLFTGACGNEESEDSSKSENSQELCDCLKKAESNPDVQKCDPSMSVKELRGISRECRKAENEEEREKFNKESQERKEEFNRRSEERRKEFENR